MDSERNSGGDEYLARVKEGAGRHDWQRDFAQTVTPVLVGVARSLGRSADAQALIMRLCELVAAELHLRPVWPEDPDASNDLRNAIYRACLDASEVESEEVLAVVRTLPVTGPQ